VIYKEGITDILTSWYVLGDI